MSFETLATAGLLVAATALAGCGAARDVELRGSTGTDADLGGPIWILVVDAEAFDAGQRLPVIAVVAQQHQPGAFAVRLETDAEALEVFAIRDNDESRSCSGIDDTMRARVVIGDAERVDVPELDVASGQPASGLALPVDCPAYALSF